MTYDQAEIIVEEVKSCRGLMNLYRFWANQYPEPADPSFAAFIAVVMCQYVEASGSQDF